MGSRRPRTRAPAVADPTPPRASRTLPSFRLGAPVRRQVEAVAAAAQRIATDPEPSVEELHRFHQSLRRIRCVFRALEGSLPPGRRSEGRALGRRLARLAHLVGEVRDLDVGISHLPVLAAAETPTEEPSPALLVRRRMHEEAHTGRALLGAVLRSELERGLFGAPGALLGAIPRSRLEGPSARRMVGRAIRAQASRTERARKRAARRPGTVRMHDLRIELRRAHYLVDLGEAASPSEYSPFPSSLARVQRSLGALHDLDRLNELLKELGRETLVTPWVRAEERRRRELRRDIARRIQKRAFRTAVEALG